jgi:DNA-binding IclR family transcriptional regulator
MTVTIRFTRSMHALLDWFNDQPCSCATVGHITDGIGYSRETVRGNLKQLVAADVAELRHEPTGEYRLIADPRDTDD